MPTQTMVNPSEEQIGLGEISVRFLLTGGDTGGKLSLFEMYVPAGERLRAPTHMNDEYEETIYGIEGVMTPLMQETEARYPGIKVFSLPFVGTPEIRRHVELGVRGEPAEVGPAMDMLREGVTQLGYDWEPLPAENKRGA